VESSGSLIRTIFCRIAVLEPSQKGAGYLRRIKCVSNNEIKSQRKTQITCSKSKRPLRILSSFSSHSDFSALVLIFAIIFFSVLQSSLNYTSEAKKKKHVRSK